MKKSSIVSSLVLFVAAMMLSGCLFPFWGYDDGYRGGGHGGHHDNGRHGGGRH
jgi:hypothetical protein